MWNEIAMVVARCIRAVYNSYSSGESLKYVLVMVKPFQAVCQAILEDRTKTKQVLWLHTAGFRAL